MTATEPDTRAMPNGTERPGEHWNARLIREAAERQAAADRAAAHATPLGTRAQDAELAPWIRRAIGDPGSIASYRRGPHWPEGHEGWAEQAESVTAWATRAVLRVLAVDGRPRCERCSQVIRVDDLYEPPLPGVGLWEHLGVCPPAPDGEGCNTEGGR
jgi:hypothetical protein